MPAMAIVEGIRDRCPHAQILYVGTNRGMEERIAKAFGLDFTGIDALGIKGKSPLNLAKAAFVNVGALARAVKIVRSFRPDWVVGTSIGAVNAALIAGNAPQRRLERLQEFWRRVSLHDLLPLDWTPASGDATELTVRFNIWNATARALTRGIASFFEPRLFNPFVFGLPVQPERASFYDTAPLADTLRELVEIERINSVDAADTMRLTVSAVKVTTAELVNFDSKFQRLDIEHILASGAIPP